VYARSPFNRNEEIAGGLLQTGTHADVNEYRLEEGVSVYLVTAEGHDGSNDENT